MRWLGGKPAFTLVLHTWTQDLRVHLHVHALMACGALSPDGRWQTPKRGERFLFPVHALSKVFKGKFLAALQAAGDKLARDPATPAQRKQRSAKLRRHDWVVYAKTALAGPAQVLEYLARYTHRVAISNERIVRIAPNSVHIRIRDNSGKTGRKTQRIEGREFIARFVRHVLPAGFKRIRHYGLLAPAAKLTKLQQARQALAMPAPSATACEDAQAFMRRVASIEIGQCPHCKLGRWLTVQSLVPQRAPQPDSASCRGPPQSQG
jgi:hypothetical protein